MKFYYYPRQKYVPCSRVQKLYLYILKAAGHCACRMARELFKYAAFSQHDKEKQETQICAWSVNNILVHPKFHPP